MPNNERDALIAALNDDTAAAHIYPSTLKTFQRGEHGGECWSIKVGNEDEESVGVFTVQQIIDALAATAPNARAPAEPTEALQRMTASRASFFMTRFLREEKLLGPNEQAALHFVIDMLAAAPAQQAGAPLPMAPSEAMAEAAIAKRLIELHALMKRTSSMPIMNEWQWLNHLRNTLQARAATPQQATLPAAPLQELHDLLYSAQRTTGEPQAKAIGAARLVLHKLRATLPASEVDDEAIEDFLAERMTAEGRVPMIATIRAALARWGATSVQPQADAADEPDPISFDPKNVIGLNVAAPQADAAEPVATQSEDARDVIGKALSDYMTENSEAGVFSTDPFDSREIDALANAVFAAQQTGKGM